MSRLLLVADSRALTSPLITSRIDSWGTVYAYFLSESFMELGFDIEMESEEVLTAGLNQRLDDSIQFNHALIILNHASSSRGEVLFNNIRPYLKEGGLIATIDDHDLDMGFEDIRFHATTISPEEEPDRKHQIFWGANPSMLEPEKDDRIFRIFLDCWYFDELKWDRTRDILIECLKFKSNPCALPEGKEEVEVIGFGKSGLHVFSGIEDLDYLVQQPPRIGLDEFLKTLRRTDLFMVTHTESMGLSILEAGMAGCLIGLPVPVPGQTEVGHFIKPDLAATIKRYEYPMSMGPISINWDELIVNVDVEESCRHSRQYTWLELSRRIVEGFNSRSPPEIRLIAEDRIDTSGSTRDNAGRLRKLMLSNLEYIRDPSSSRHKRLLMTSWWDTEYADRIGNMGEWALQFIEDGLIVDNLGINTLPEEKKIVGAMANWLLQEISGDDEEMRRELSEGAMALDSDSIEYLVQNCQDMVQFRTAIQLMESKTTEWRAWSTGRILQEKYPDDIPIMRRWTELEPENKNSWIVLMRRHWDSKLREECYWIGVEASRLFPEDEWILRVTENCRVQCGIGD